MSVKSWWESLLDRERQMLTIGGVVVGILCVYLLIWSPLSEAVSDRKTEITSQRQLLQYLRQAAQTVQTMKAEGIQVSASSQGDLLSVAEETLAQQQLSHYLKQVQQPDQNQVTLTFEAVPFDKLMQWIELLATRHSVHPAEVSATRLSVAGTADVTMTLSA